MNHLENSNFSQFKGLIFDIDGTLTHDGKAIAGAIDVIKQLREQEFQLRFVTNTTGRSPHQLATQLSRLGFCVIAEEIQTSVTACKHYLSTEMKGKSGYLAIPDVTKPMLTGIEHNEINPDFVVIGDLENGFDYKLLNKLFNFIHNGARLIAFHRNPFYFREGKTWLDSGAFTRVFEGITNQAAIITGKPSSALFNSAVSSMGLMPEQVLVVGDDVSSDIQGANNSGLHSILVGTGKFKPEHLTGDFPKANTIIDSLTELTNLLSNIKAGK